MAISDLFIQIYLLRYIYDVVKWVQEKMVAVLVPTKILHCQNYIKLASHVELHSVLSR